MVLTWNHRICDARGAMGILAALPRLAQGERLGEPWWRTGYREGVDLPASAVQRGLEARGALPWLEALRREPWLRMIRTAPYPAAPVNHVSLDLGRETALLDLRQRAACGRMSELPFYLACVAAALEAACGVGEDLLFPLAVDMRTSRDRRLLANRHGFLILSLPAGMASTDLGTAARHIKEEQRRWVHGAADTKLMSALSWFPRLGYRFAHAQLGFNHGGIAASCLVAHTGRTLIPSRWFGGDVIGVDHGLAPPGNPGLAVLFHRDDRGVGCDLVSVGRVSRRLPPDRLARLLREQLLDRSFVGSPR